MELDPVVRASGGKVKGTPEGVPSIAGYHSRFAGPRRSTRAFPARIPPIVPGYASLFRRIEGIYRTWPLIAYPTEPSRLIGTDCYKYR